MKHIDKKLDRDYTYIGILVLAAFVAMVAATKYKSAQSAIASQITTEKAR